MHDKVIADPNFTQSGCWATVIGRRAKAMTCSSQRNEGTIVSIERSKGLQEAIWLDLQGYAGLMLRHQLLHLTHEKRLDTFAQASLPSYSNVVWQAASHADHDNNLMK